MCLVSFPCIRATTRIIQFGEGHQVGHWFFVGLLGDLKVNGAGIKPSDATAITLCIMIL